MTGIAFALSILFALTGFKLLSIERASGTIETKDLLREKQRVTGQKPQIFRPGQVCLSPYKNYGHEGLKLTSYSWLLSVNPRKRTDSISAALSDALLPVLLYCWY